MERRALSDELEKYGYVFSVKRTVFSFFIAFVLLLLLGRFFGLRILPQAVLTGAGLLLLPLFVRNSWKSRYDQQRFSDVNVYMEQFLYSFQKSGKILETLGDVSGIFEEGEMKQTIERARFHIEHTYHDPNFEEKALAMIEEEYLYSGLKMMHRFALRTESIGGEYQESVQLLLEARRMWADRVYELMQAKKKKRQEVILSILTSLLLCSMIYYMAARMDLDVASHPVAQVMTLLVLLLDFLIYYRTDCRLATGYLAEDKRAEMRALEQMERMKSYKDTPFGRFAKNAAKKNITRELEKCFPEWLMELSLLLQSENVQVAIFRSYDDAPDLLKPELEKLIGRLKANPADRDAYTDFLSGYTLPEVKSSMKMLYSISEGSGGDARNQIEDIIRRNQKLLDKAEKMKDEDALSGMYALFLAPQLTGGVKLVTDMVLMFIIYLAGITKGGVL